MSLSLVNHTQKHTHTLKVDSNHREKRFARNNNVHGNICEIKTAISLSRSTNIRLFIFGIKLCVFTLIRHSFSLFLARARSFISRLPEHTLLWLAWADCYCCVPIAGCRYQRWWHATGLNNLLHSFFCCCSSVLNNSRVSARSFFSCLST